MPKQQAASIMHTWPSYSLSISLVFFDLLASEGIKVQDLRPRKHKHKVVMNRLGSYEMNYITNVQNNP